jgi:hypothetical protein
MLKDAANLFRSGEVSWKVKNFSNVTLQKGKSILANLYVTTTDLDRQKYFQMKM